MNATERTWQGRDVSVAAIGAVLAGLWRSGSEAAGVVSKPPTRTSVFNLVVYTDSPTGADHAVAALRALAERHPSRTILVVADPTGPSTLDAALDSQCGAVLAQAHLCWEQVTLTVHGPAAAHASSIVVPLLVPSLPTYLWWDGDLPFDAPAFKDMAPTCDRLIVESSLCTDAFAALPRLAAVCHEDVDRGVSDIDWMRLTPWRNLAAQFFDPLDARPCTRNVANVDIVYGAGDGGKTASPAQALLLAGWLTSCLGWNVVEAVQRGDDILYIGCTGRDGSPVALSLTPRVVASVEAGHVATLTLRSTLNGAPAVFAVARGDDDDVTTTATVGDAALLARTTRMVTRPFADLLAEELDIFKHDRMYERALAVAADMAVRLVYYGNGHHPAAAST